MRLNWRRQAESSGYKAGTGKQKKGRVTIGAGASALVIASLAGSVAFATDASASAYGCTTYGHKVSYKGVTVANGTWCGTINGSGTYVNYVGGNFYTHIVPLDQICNFSERSEFYDSNGHYYGYAQTPIAYRCSNLSDLPNMYLKRNMSRGYVLMKLISNGGTVATVLESIT
jgi:hypothetical protein